MDLSGSHDYRHIDLVGMDPWTSVDLGGSHGRGCTNLGRGSGLVELTSVNLAVVDLAAMYMTAINMAAIGLVNLAFVNLADVYLTVMGLYL